MQSVLLTISYRGTDFAGWQRQDGFPTIQECLENALQTIFGEPVVVHGSGRTDAGVHALRQMAHARLPVSFPIDDLPRALNGNIPDAISVSAARIVPASFHARFSATGKRYLYRYLVSRIRPAMGREYAHWVKRPLDLDAMREAAMALVGEHDFAAFASNPGYERKRATVRRLRHVRLIRRPHGIDLVVQGNGFLYNMVRAIAGTLQQVGVGRIPPARVQEILESKDREQAGMTAPACGLYLCRVLYPAGIFTAEDSGCDGALSQ